VQYGFIEQIKGVLIVGFSNVPPSLVSSGLQAKRNLFSCHRTLIDSQPPGSIDQRPLKCRLSHSGCQTTPDWAVPLWLSIV
jgi:hypothetical protein